ncbi:hypothetical protein P3342_010983 [Pyrenophora teres f. teres]|nr:hypothetical protein P3342_010983 [Pyrenophora teres f. teres]
MQQRREEILAKKAKLAELKRQRELRRAESASRQSMTGSPLGEVGTRTLVVTKQATNPHVRSFHQHPDAAKISTAGPMSPTSSIAFWGKQARLHPTWLSSRPRPSDPANFSCQCRST